MTATVPEQKQRLLDWPAIKGDYVEGISQGSTRRYPTYEDLAVKYECHPVTIRQRGGAEDWKSERATFQRRLEEERRTQRTHELATLAADLDVNALRIARSGMSITAARLSELGTQAQQRAMGLQQGTDPHTLPPAPNADEMRALSLTAKEWYDLGVKALGMEMPQHLIITGDPEMPVKVDVTARDARTLEIVNILQEAGALPNGDDGRAVLDVAGSETGGTGEADAVPPDDEVHPEHVGDGAEREQEAGSVPAA